MQGVHRALSSRGNAADSDRTVTGPRKIEKKKENEEKNEKKSQSREQSH